MSKLYEASLDVQRVRTTRITKRTLCLPEWLAQYLVDNNKIAAIKAARVEYGHKDPITGVVTHMPLSSAKNLVEAFRIERDVHYEDDINA